MVKTPCFHSRDMGSIPGLGTKVTRAARLKKYIYIERERAHKQRLSTGQWVRG